MRSVRNQALAEDAPESNIVVAKILAITKIGWSRRRKIVGLFEEFVNGRSYEGMEMGS